MITVGDDFVFGVQESLPAKGFPEGRIRWSQRDDCLALTRVKTPAGIREFLVISAGGFWVPGEEIGRNDTAKTS